LALGVRRDRPDEKTQHDESADEQIQLESFERGKFAEQFELHSQFSPFSTKK